ncbi:MAG: c-type cytochrome domain-containing protein [Planctomycetaceae bacterium]
MLKPHQLLLAAIVGLSGCSAVVSAEPEPAAQVELSPEELRFFENRIRPALVQHCYECHSSQSQSLEGGLSVETRAGLREGGDSGPAVVPGDVAASPLIKAVKHETFEMPPDGKLAPEVIADLTRWVEMGAPDPREGAPPSRDNGIDLVAGRQHWSFQPIRDIAAPQVTADDWSRSTIDRWLLSRCNRMA